MQNPTATVRYAGNFVCEVTHSFSGTTYLTDAPLDNGGRASAISPTDSVGTALVTCMLTTLALVARRANLPDPELTAAVHKTMADGPRRISHLAVEITLHSAAAYSDRDLQLLHNAALTCPVKRALHPDIAVEVVWK
jgi:uncharacterized OsmC-like protein